MASRYHQKTTDSSLQKALKLATPANSFSGRAPKPYRAIVRELAEPNASVNGIARRYRVSNHTVMGIREREAKSIENEKNTWSPSSQMWQPWALNACQRRLAKRACADAAIGTGVAVDKLLALTGQLPGVQWPW
jgi:hypothetical protein